MSNKRWDLPRTISTYEEFLEFTLDLPRFSPHVADLERRLLKLSTTNQAIPTSNLPNLLGIEPDLYRNTLESDLCADIQKYELLAKSIAEYPQEHPRRIVIRVSELTLESSVPSKKLYAASVDDIDRPINNKYETNWQNDFIMQNIEDFLFRYLYFCLTPMEDLQRLIQQRLLITGIPHKISIEDLILHMREYDLEVPLKPKIRGLFFQGDIEDTKKYLGVGFADDFDQKGRKLNTGFVLNEFCITETTLKRGLDKIKSILSQKGMPNFKLEIGEIKTGKLHFIQYLSDLNS